MSGSLAIDQGALMRCHVIEPPGILLDMPKPQPSPSHPPPPPPLRQQLISITPEMSTSTSKAAAVPTPQSPQSPAVATLLRQVTLLPPQQPPRNAVPNPKPATAPQVQPITPPTARAGAQQGQHAQHAQQGGPSVPSTAAPPTPSAPTAGADWFALYQRLYGPQHAPSTPTAPYSIYSIQMTPQQPQFLAPPTTHLSSFPQGPGASLQGLTVGVSAPSGNRPSPPTMQRPHAEGPTGPAVRRHPPPPPPPPPVPPLWLWQAAMAQGPQGFTMGPHGPQGCPGCSHSQCSGCGAPIDPFGSGYIPLPPTPPQFHSQGCGGPVDPLGLFGGYSALHQRPGQYPKREPPQWWQPGVN